LVICNGDPPLHESATGDLAAEDQHRFILVRVGGAGESPGMRTGNGGRGIVAKPEIIGQAVAIRVIGARFQQQDRAFLAF
jgi:hypothetical protein